MRGLFYARKGQNMTATKPVGTYGNGVGTVSPLDHKMAQTALFTKTTTANLIRTGVLYNGNASLITGKANMSYDVSAFSAALTRGASAGTVILTNDGTLNVTTTAAPGSNSRIDIIYVWAREYSLDGTDSNPVIAVTQGTAAAVPTAPSLAAFPGAIELGRATVGAGITATTSATITQTAPFTSAHGARVPFRTTTEMDLWTTALPDQLAVDLSTLVNYRRSGSAWVPAFPASVLQRVTRSAVAPTVSSVSYTDLSANANWSTTTPAAQSSGFAAYANGITVPVAGVYRVGYSITSSANIGLLVGVTVNKSVGVAFTDFKAACSAFPVGSVAAAAASEEVRCAAGDVLRLFAIAASGTPAIVASQGSFYAEWIRAD